MEGIFREFENENALRSYPFAAGCIPPDDEDAGIPSGVFVDAALYPVNPTGTLYLSSISDDGVFSVSDDNGVVMTGTKSGSLVEMYDASAFKRHVGTLMASSAEALDEFAGRGVNRDYKPSNSTFSSTCVFPVVIDGVLSLSVDDSGSSVGELGFTNADDDAVRVSSGKTPDGRSTIRFDVLPTPVLENDDSIKRIVCVVDGQTPFRIEKLAYNTICLRLDGIDKDMICSAAHRENQYEMADTCECKKTGNCEQEATVGLLPEHYSLLEVYIPPDEQDVDEDGNAVYDKDKKPVYANGGVPDGADNAFFMVAPNLNGYVNPLSIMLEDGLTVPDTDGPRVVMTGQGAELADGEMVDALTSNGIILQVPGLSGGST